MTRPGHAPRRHWLDGIDFAQAGFDYRKNPLEEQAYSCVTPNAASI